MFFFCEGFDRVKDSMRLRVRAAVRRRWEWARPVVDEPGVVLLPLEAIVEHVGAIPVQELASLLDRIRIIVEGFDRVGVKDSTG